MNTDLNRVEQITKEMKINDLLFDEMKNEYIKYAEGLYQLDRKKLPEALERLYYHRRMLSVLSGRDLPFRSAIGLYTVKEKFLKIEARRGQYIGDSDSDTEIYAYLMELGYRLYDLVTPTGVTPEEMYKKLIGQRGDSNG